MPTPLGRIRQFWETMKPLGEALDRLEAYSTLEDAERELEGRIARLQQEESDASARVAAYVEQESQRLIEEKTRSASVEALRVVNEAKSEADRITLQAQRAGDQQKDAAAAEAKQIREAARADAEREALRLESLRREAASIEVTIAARSEHLAAINKKIDEAKQLLAAG